LNVLTGWGTGTGSVFFLAHPTAAIVKASRRTITVVNLSLFTIEASRHDNVHAILPYNFA
jgi:hypothetical protein